MPEENEEIKKMENRIAKLDAQQKQLKAKKRALRNRISQQNRKARTKRLIEKGGVIEKLQGSNASEINAEQTLEQLQKLAYDSKRLRALESFANGLSFQHNPNDTVLTRFDEELKKNPIS